MTEQLNQESETKTTQHEGLAGWEKATFSLIFAWALCCVGSILWLRFKVTIDANDLANASWLPSYVTATHFTGLFMGVLCSAVFLMSFAVAIVNNSPFPMIFGLAFILSMAGNDESHIVRVGIATDTIKIGCYVYESKECREMVGLPVGDAMSRYDNLGSFAPWYFEALKRTKRGSEFQEALLSMPGMAFLSAPFYIFDADRIRQKVAEQRTELEAIKKEASSQKCSNK